MNQTVNVIPEINLMAIFGGVVSALGELQKYGISHGNVSGRTIFLGSNGYWQVTTPNFQKINLMRRVRSERDLDFLLSTRMKTQE